MADYGADVIKVEPPAGDVSRRVGPFAGDHPHPEKRVVFLYIHTNKRGITLDLTSQTGKTLLAQLIKSSDILVQNFDPGEAESLGLTYPAIGGINPRLVATAITPFGQTGPYKDLAATDIITCALSGLMYQSGDSDREPLRNALDQSFYVAGINAAVATLAAIFQRLTTGMGQQVDVSVAECLASHLVQLVPYYTYMGAIKGRRPVRGYGFEELMPARGGYVTPSVQGSQPWSTVANLIGLKELQDQRFATGGGRIEHGRGIAGTVDQGSGPNGTENPCSRPQGNAVSSLAWPRTPTIFTTALTFRKGDSSWRWNTQWRAKRNTPEVALACPRRNTRCTGRRRC